jgi:hypothetical protein
MSKRKQKKSQVRTGAEAAAAASGHSLLQYVYAVFGLFWLYQGMVRAQATLAQFGGTAELGWLIPAAVAYFALMWFLYQLAVEAAARQQMKIAQGLFVLLFLAFLAGFALYAFAATDSLRAAAQSCLSFAIAGLMLKLSTIPGGSGGTFGSMLARRAGG